jgi:hypothetical protein
MACSVKRTKCDENKYYVILEKEKEKNGIVYTSTPIEFFDIPTFEKFLT